MLNSDKAHIYKLLEYVKHELLTANESLQKETAVTFENERSDLLAPKTRPLQNEISTNMLRSMILFKSDLINDIEGSANLSFDSVLIRVEHRCEEWRSLIKGNYRNSLT